MCRKRAGDLVIRCRPWNQNHFCVLNDARGRCEALQQRVGSGRSSDIDQAYLQVAAAAVGGGGGALTTSPLMCGFILRGHCAVFAARCVLNREQMELELRLSDEKAQCKAASACWKVAYSDPDCRNALGQACHTSHLTPHTSHLTPHTSHLTPHTSHLTPHTSHLTPHNNSSHVTLCRL